MLVSVFTIANFLSGSIDDILFFIMGPMKKSKNLLIKTADGESIAVKNGDIIGRNAVGADLFKHYKNISRNHVRFMYDNDRWYIEDLNSANGTYINGLRILPHKKAEISDKTVVGLSDSFHLLIEAAPEYPLQANGIRKSFVETMAKQKKDLTVMFSDLKNSVVYFERKGTVIAKAWLMQHENILSAVIDSYNGIIVKKTGDGMMVLFHEAEDAVHAAIMIQQALEKHNKSAAEDEQYFIRISLNNGKVLFDGMDAYGNVVNIASRIEALALPGQILASEFLYKSIQKHPEIKMLCIGKKALKGLKEEINIYEVLWNTSSASPPFSR
jgi:class 3 adenylate cyclase